jgi:hypothetical protein
MLIGIKTIQRYINFINAKLGLFFGYLHNLNCFFSLSTFELINLVLEILHSAADSSTDKEACRLLNTARNVLDMFVNTAPDYHMKALTSVPQIAG